MSSMQQKAGIEKYRNINSWCILLFVPLSTLVTPVDMITYGDLLLFIDILLLLFAILTYRVNLSKIVSLELLLFILFILIHSFIAFVLNSNNILQIVGLFRYLMHMTVVILGAKHFINRKYFYKVYMFLAIIFATYCIAQYVMFEIFTIVLPPNIFNLPTHEYIYELYSEENLKYYAEGLTVNRPRSMFLEPSYYALYQVIIVYYVLIISDIKQHIKYIFSIFITISICLSGAATGIILICFCWIKPIMDCFRKLNIYSVATICAIIGSIGVIFNSNYIVRMLSRIVSLDGSLGNATLGRIENFSMFIDGSIPYYNIIFGYGMWEDNSFLPSLGAIPFKFGIIGLFIFIFVIFFTFLNCKKLGKLMILLLSIMMIGTNPIFEITSVLVFTVIYNDCGNITHNNLLKGK